VWEHREGYLPTAIRWYRAIAPLVYHNDGNGHFTEISRKWALPSGQGLGIAFADYDRDGHLDIFVANDSMPEFFITTKAMHIRGTCAALRRRRGWRGPYYAVWGRFRRLQQRCLPDLVVTALASQMYAFIKQWDGTLPTTVIHPDSAADHKHSGGCTFLDYDNDGWKDLLINQGHDLDTVPTYLSHLRYKNPCCLQEYRQEFRGRFCTSREIFQKAWVGPVGNRRTLITTAGGRRVT